ncbi:hypothetical protein LTR66_006053 [Elasticomyces elasticus]|nr:hypothetical protein LTR66_006053 [Elasticomyces elasticus]
MFLPYAAGIDTSRIPPPPYRPLGLFTSYAIAEPPGGWSSIIGIVTAIIGNILISFALNTQRYAHLRLNRESEEQFEQQESSKRKAKKGENNGTQQATIAEERAKKNLEAPRNRPKYELNGAREASEEDPLIPSLSRKHSESSSASTVRAGEKRQDAPKEKSYLRSPYWWAGISLMTVGEAGNFLAYGFAPASIVSPLGVVALISNCLIAPWMLHERFRWRDGLGVVIAVAGCVTVVLSASGSNPRLGPDEMWALITRWEFETYLGVTTLLIVVLMSVSAKYGGKSIIIDLGLVGLFGGYTALSTKGVASLLSNTIWRAVTFPITYLLVFVLVVTAIMQIRYINRALQRFDSTQVIPIQFVMFTISVIIGSAVLYRDFERKTAEDAAKFFGGCALTFLGVWCITSGRSQDQDGDEGEANEDDAIDLLDEEDQQEEIRQHSVSPTRRVSFARGSSSLEPPSWNVRSSSSPPITFTPEHRLFSGPQTPQCDIVEPSPLAEDLRNTSLTAANLSAIHQKSTSYLPQDPSTPSPSKKPPPIHATTSAPIVPTTSSTNLAVLRPKTPMRHISERPRTPPRMQSQQLLDPATTAANGSRFGRMNRHSITTILPGPLMSPLSSSLSAIVADSLRRGVDAPTRRSAKAGRKRGLSGQRRSVAEGTMGRDADPFVGSDGVGGSSQAVGRGRSFSAVVGDIFRRKKDDGDAEQGREGGS